MLVRSSSSKSETDRLSTLVVVAIGVLLTSSVVDDDNDEDEDEIVVVVVVVDICIVATHTSATHERVALEQRIVDTLGKQAQLIHFIFFFVF